MYFLQDYAKKYAIFLMPRHFADSLA